MKDQYFGDINDYRKYGLLRVMGEVTQFNTLVAWMLTPDDGSTDGNFTTYLKQPNKWRHHDPELYEGLQGQLTSRSQRKVAMIESSDLLPKTQFFCNHVPDQALMRGNWFDSLLADCDEADFVFLDPDNGLEVKSRPYGNKHSSKFLYWREVDGLWREGKSLLIYQHFIREKRDQFIQRMLETLTQNTPGSVVEAYSTPHVLFLLALQPGHYGYLRYINQSVNQNWCNQIWHWGD